jgi:hypothetical protein
MKRAILFLGLMKRNGYRGAWHIAGYLAKREVQA